MSSAIKFKKICVNDAKLILEWRTSERVTNFMNTDLEYNLSDQIDWINNLKKSETSYYWVIQINNTSIGLIYITNLNISQKSASWGYYIGDENFLGLGSLVPPYLYNFLFNELHLNVLQAEVFYDNLTVIKMHLKFGYEFDPSNDRVIKKNNRVILLIAMNLYKSNWNSLKYKKFTSNFKL